MITFVIIYASNIGEPRICKANIHRLKGRKRDNTIIVGDLNTVLRSLDRSPRSKINKETLALNDMLDQMNKWMNIYDMHT